MAPADRGGRFEEGQRAFGLALDLAAYYDSYSYRCAFTGDDLRDEIDLNPLAALLRLTPAGDLRADLVVPASAAARDAFRVYQISIGANYDILVNRSRCPKPLWDRLSAQGLLLPAAIEFYPNLRVLAEHAQDFASGRLIA